MKKIWIIIPAAVLLLLSGCGKNISTEETSAQPGETSVITDGQTVLESVTNGEGYEIKITLEDEPTTVKTTVTTTSAATRETTTVNETESTRSAVQQTTKSAEERTTVESTTRKSEETTTSGSGATVPTTRNDTQTTTSGGKDKFELPAIPLN